MKIPFDEQQRAALRIPLPFFSPLCHFKIDRDDFSHTLRLPVADAELANETDVRTCVADASRSEPPGPGAWECGRPAGQGRVGQGPRPAFRDVPVSRCHHTPSPADIRSHVPSPVSDHAAYSRSFLHRLKGRKFPRITSWQRQEATPGINGLS